MSIERMNRMEKSDRGGASNGHRLCLFSINEGQLDLLIFYIWHGDQGEPWN